MTIEETLKILAVIKSNYPYFYKGLSDTDAKIMVDLWADLFQDDSVELVGAAVKTYIACDLDGYPPTVGKIKEQIRKLTHSEDMSEQEAINRLLKACANSGYNAAEEFEALPSELKQLVGNAQQLREWGKLKTDDLHTVVASNVMRSYKAIKERERQKNALPKNLKNILDNVAEQKRLE